MNLPLNRREFTVLLAAAMPSCFKLESLLAQESGTLIHERVKDIPEVDSDKYSKIIERYKQKEGFKVARVEYFLHTNFWNSMPHNLEIKEFYNQLQHAPFVNKTTIELVVRKNPITTQEFLNQFLEGADLYIQNTTPPHRYELDLQFQFTNDDKNKLHRILEGKLRSPVSQEIIENGIKTGKKIEVYLRGTTIITEVDYVDCQNPAVGLADPIITIYSRFPGEYRFGGERYKYGKRKMILDGVNDKIGEIEKDIFMKMLRGNLLTRDYNHSPKKEIFVPIDYLYDKYKQRDNQ